MSFIKKWYTYQKERFPIIAYGLYCFCLVFGVFCYSNYLIKNDYCIAVKDTSSINYYFLIPMFLVGFLQFLMVRIVDEFKDYEEDCKYRAYRPVPRGLVTLKELRVLFIICAFLQVIITIIVNTKSLIFLGIVWLFFIVMSKGFFIKNFLDRHILVEVLLDEILLPITMLYVVSFLIIINLNVIWKFLVLAYIISWIIEIARKIRCKEKEEEGVKTYTAVFGIPKATLLLYFLETILLVLFNSIMPIKIYMLIYFGIISIVNILFIIKQSKTLSDCVQYLADIYVMGMLVSFVYLLF